MVLSQQTFAGGLLTNTNQNAAFDRMLSRDAAIGIDGVYANPAGVAFLSPGWHLSFNWQLAFQSRTIKNSYPLFARNQQNPSTERTFEGKAFAPVIPSIQAAYNWNKFSFQAMFGVTGGGGKCTFDNGLGSFEKVVGETAQGVNLLAQALDHATSNVLGLSSANKFGNQGTYAFESYMRGRQYYYSLSLGAAYRITPELSAFAGVRGIYAMSNYYGYVRNIKVGKVPLYTMLDKTKPSSADIQLNCDQTGIGFTPIIGVDYKVGKWNFAAKYEFKTRIRLKNESVNQLPSIGNLPTTLGAMLITEAHYTPAQAQALLTNPAISGGMQLLKQQFDHKMDEAIGEFSDGKTIANDIPAYLALGVGYTPTDRLKLNVGFHFFDDKHATSYGHREKKLKRGTLEYNAGAEYLVNQCLTVSAGWQNTSYGLTKEYMDDKSFVANSNSVGAGVCLHLSEKMNLNLGYFHTFYGHVNGDAGNYKADFTRNNNVFAAGLDINF